MRKIPHKLKVKRLYAGWTDELTRKLTYDAVCDFDEPSGIKNPPNHVISIHRFYEARRRWNAFVARAFKQEKITKLQLTRRVWCRYSGLELNSPPQRYSCGDPVCPYCFYRKTLNIVKNTRGWLENKSVDILTVSIPVKTDIITGCVPAKKYRFYPCKEVRSLVNSLTKDVPGIYTTRLDPYETQKNGLIFVHKLTVIGPHIPADVKSQMLKSSVVSQYTKFVFKQNVLGEDAITSLNYPQALMRTSYDMSRKIHEWNKNYRTTIRK